MRKTILMILLALVSSSAMAGWVELGRNESSTLYGNPASIREAGSLVKMWTLSDARTVQWLRDKSYVSVKMEWEYDCKEKQMRLLAIAYYSGNMGSGEAISFKSGGPVSEKWGRVVPDSIEETFWKLACGRE